MSAKPRGNIRLGIDTGGTFTDVVAFDEDSGAVHTTKTPTTPQDPSIGFMAGVPYRHPLGHRGLTHSLFFALILALLVAIHATRRATARGASGKKRRNSW